MLSAVGDGAVDIRTHLDCIVIQGPSSVEVSHQLDVKFDSLPPGRCLVMSN